MVLPLEPPISPMLAKAVRGVPAQDSVPGGLVYEPKWDGFRAIVYVDGDSVELGSRGAKMLTRYFPELVESLRRGIRTSCVLDGEIVVRSGAAGAERLDWEALSQRIHPAASRVATLAEQTPASFVAFDLLAIDGRSLLDEPFSVRRVALEGLLERAPRRRCTSPAHTRDRAVAERWFVEFEGAGLDGVVAKPLDAPYSQGKRVMLKSKHQRTADAVVTGYRRAQERHRRRLAAARSVLPPTAR